MLKKYFLLSTLGLVSFGLKADVLNYLPAKSEIRTYCQNNKDNENCQIIVKCLEDLSISKGLECRIHALELKIGKLNKKYSEVKSENIENFEQYVSLKKANLLAGKAILERNYLPRNFFTEDTEKDKSEFKTALDNILQTIEPRRHDQECQYLQQGFENAWRNENPLNTFTIKEKIVCIGKFTLASFVALSQAYFVAH